MWRNHIYNIVINAFKNVADVAPQLHQLGYRDKARQHRAAPHPYHSRASSAPDTAALSSCRAVYSFVVAPMLLSLAASWPLLSGSTGVEREG